MSLKKLDPKKDIAKKEQRNARHKALFLRELIAGEHTSSNLSSSEDKKLFKEFNKLTKKEKSVKLQELKKELRKSMR